MAIMRIMKMLLKTIMVMIMIAMKLTRALKSRPDWTLLRWWSKTTGLQPPIFRSLRHKKRKHKVALVHISRSCRKCKKAIVVSKAVAKELSLSARADFPPVFF